MSEVERFVAELQRAGVRFWIEGDRLRWHSMAALKIDQVLAIKTHTAEIIELIKRRS